jgi:hypothetical protein
MRLEAKKYRSDMKGSGDLEPHLLASRRPSELLRDLVAESPDLTGRNWSPIPLGDGYLGAVLSVKPDRGIDGNGLDHWASFWGTGNGLEEAYLSTQATGSGAAWMAWSPPKGGSGNCRQATLGINGMLKAGDYGSVGGSISFPVEFCEMIDITKSNPAVYFKIHWDYCQMFCIVGMRDSRDLEELIGWSQNAGTNPTWVNGIGIS